MKQFRMTDRKGPPERSTRRSSPSDSAFDRWLNRGLHELFDDVMNEPVPPELMKLVKEDKDSRTSKKEDDKEK